MERVKVLHGDESEIRELFEEEAKRIHQFYLNQHQEHIADLRKRLFVLEEWWTLEETAEKLGVKPDTVRKIYTKQGLKYSRKGQNLYFHRDDVYAWIETGRVELRKVKKAS